MKPRDTKILKVKNTLDGYKNRIIEGEELDKERDQVEIDIEGGRIHVQPLKDGTTVTIHYFNDNIDKDPTFNGTGEILYYITDTLNFPPDGKYRPNVSFVSSEHRKHKIDFRYFTDEG